jgi:hypothetical protein
LDIEKVKKAVEAANNALGTVLDRNLFSYKIIEEQGKKRVFITLTLPHTGSIIEREVTDEVASII